MSVMDVQPGTPVEDLVRWTDKLVDLRGAGAREPFHALLREVAALYVRVGQGRCEPVDRDRIRTLARAARAAGATEDALREAIRRLTGEAVRRTSEPLAMYGVSSVVLAESLGDGTYPYPSRLERLLNGESPERAIRGLAETYTVVVFQIPERGRAGVLGLLSQLDGQLLDEQELLAGCHGHNAVLLVPGAQGERYARWLVADIAKVLRVPLSAALSGSVPGLLTAGYREATCLLALVRAAERPPGLYRIDDFLIEYAAMQSPAVSARLLDIVRPLLGSDRLYETLQAFIRCGHDRGRTARELLVHRSTVDYRIKRIAEITGHDPTSCKGGQVLAAAVTLFALQNL